MAPRVQQEQRGRLDIGELRLERLFNCCCFLHTPLQDDFHELPTGRAGESFQGGALSGRVRSRNALLEDGSARGSHSGETLILIIRYGCLVFFLLLASRSVVLRVRDVHVDGEGAGKRLGEEAASDSAVRSINHNARAENGLGAAGFLFFYVPSPPLPASSLPSRLVVQPASQSVAAPAVVECSLKRTSAV